MDGELSPWMVSALMLNADRLVNLQEIISISKETLPGYDDKIKSFFQVGAGRQSPQLGQKYRSRSANGATRVLTPTG